MQRVAYPLPAPRGALCNAPQTPGAAYVIRRMRPGEAMIGYPAPMTDPHDPTAHRTALVARCRLLLQRHLRRHWFRAIDPAHVGERFAALDEARMVLLGEMIEPPMALPPAAALDAALSASRASDADAPALAALARLGLDAEAGELLLVTAALQSTPPLLRMVGPAMGEVAARQPTAGFLIELCADDPEHAARLERALGPDWPLRRLRLLRLGDDRRWRPHPPPLMRPALAAASVERLLAGRPPFGDDWPQGALAVEVEGPPPDAVIAADRARLGRLLDGVARDGEAVILIGERGSGRRTAARAHALAAGRVLLNVDPAALPADAAGFEEALGALLRDARLADGVVFARFDRLRADDGRIAVLARLLRTMAPPLVLAASAESAPRLTAALPRLATAQMQADDGETRRALYARLLVQNAFALSRRQLTRLVDSYRLTPGDLDRALRDVRAEHAGPELDRPAFDRAVRARVRSRLSDLATSITTAQRWDDLVVGDELRGRIEEVVAHARHRTEVFEEWGFSGKVGGRGRGLSCLFSGPPGTGKTMTATLIGQALGLEVFLVDLSRVVDKYVGETEKNLARLFDEASRAPVVLLFDEADSLFATRTEVQSSNDRYANLEVNFLLQRMERFEGISILTTNRETAIDPAFKRRLRFRLHFDPPDAAQRARLWRAMVPPGCRIAADVDWQALAERWEMTGALIRNAMLRAAFLAAARQAVLDERLIREAARSELMEMGRLGG